MSRLWQPGRTRHQWPVAGGAKTSMRACFFLGPVPAWARAAAGLGRARAKEALMAGQEAGQPGFLRVGNASGFYGDRFAAVREMLEDGPLDVLTGDYLAELTMSILAVDRMKDADLGYAKTFLRQMGQCLAPAVR